MVLKEEVTICLGFIYFVKAIFKSSVAVSAPFSTKLRTIAPLSQIKSVWAHERSIGDLFKPLILMYTLSGLSGVDRCS